MKLALQAKVTVNPRRIFKNRWVHDAAHRIADSRRRAQDEEKRASGSRKS